MTLTRSRLKLELARARRPFVVYLVFAALGVAGAGWLISKLTPYETLFKHKDSTLVAFTDVKGVVPGKTPVRLAGVNIGVVGTAAVRGGEAVLTLQTFPKFGHIYRDARIDLGQQSPLGDMYVEIVSRGTRAAGVAASGVVIPATQTSTAVDISRVLNMFEPDTRRGLSTLLDELGRGLDGAQLRRTFASLAPFFGSTRRLADELAIRRTRVAQMISDFADLSSVLARRDRQLRTLVTSGDETLGTLAARDVPLQQTIAELPPTLQKIRTGFAALSALEAHLNPALDSVVPAARALPAALHSLQQLGTGGTPGVTALGAMVDRLRPLADQLAPSTVSLGHIAGHLSRQAPALVTTTSLIDPCLQSVDRFFMNSLSTGKFGDAYRATFRADVTVTLDAGTTVGADPFLHKSVPCWKGGEQAP